jgi:hypothetical protein
MKIKTSQAGLEIALAFSIVDVVSFLSRAPATAGKGAISRKAGLACAGRGSAGPVL